jgi:hypothetical protein
MEHWLAKGMNCRSLALSLPPTQPQGNRRVKNYRNASVNQGRSTEPDEHFPPRAEKLQLPEV